MAVLCEICGNPSDWGTSHCPFCGADLAALQQSTAQKAFRQKTVNLEAGRPKLETALARLNEAIASAKREGVRLLVLIHGYGSSGKGGVIKEECRRKLDYFKATGEIKEYLPGEACGRRSGSTKALVARYPQLKDDPRLSTANRGITLVVLS